MFRDGFDIICHIEMHRQAIVFALEAALHDQATQPKIPAYGRMLGEHIAGAEEEHHVAVKGLKNECDRNT